MIPNRDLDEFTEVVGDEELQIKITNSGFYQIKGKIKWLNKGDILTDKEKEE
jgi:hypothetical protein